MHNTVHPRSSVAFHTCHAKAELPRLERNVSKRKQTPAHHPRPLPPPRPTCNPHGQQAPLRPSARASSAAVGARHEQIQDTVCPQRCLLGLQHSITPSATSSLSTSVADTLLFCCLLELPSWPGGAPCSTGSSCRATPLLLPSRACKAVHTQTATHRNASSARVYTPFAALR